MDLKMQKEECFWILTFYTNTSSLQWDDDSKHQIRTCLGTENSRLLLRFSSVDHKAWLLLKMCELYIKVELKPGNQPILNNLDENFTRIFYGHKSVSWRHNLLTDTEPNMSAVWSEWITIRSSAFLDSPNFWFFCGTLLKIYNR